MPTLGGSPNKSVAILSKILVTESAILDTAYGETSDHLELVHNAIPKNLVVVMMKLDILKWNVDGKQCTFQGIETLRP